MADVAVYKSEVKPDWCPGCGDYSILKQVQTVLPGLGIPRENFVIISGIGLFGLTIFNTQKRAKEIGVRKVLGASVMQILVMLCRDFLRPIVISFLLAFPLAYYLMERFLEGYAFRISIPALSFLVVGLVMTAFVLLIVSYQSLRVAVKNPVESLKTE